MSNVDFGLAVKTPLADKEWIVKSLLAILWTFLIVTIPAVLGAEIEYIKRTAEGRDDLPDWSSFGDKWVKGLGAGLAGFIYFLPVIFGLVIALVPVVMRSGTGEPADALSAGVLIIFGLLAFAYVIGVSLFFYAALTHYAMTERFGAFFEFSEIGARVRGSGYFTAWLFAVLIGIVSSAASGAVSATWIGGILSPAISYLAMMMTSHLLGQYAAGAYGVAPVAAPYPVPPVPHAPPTAPPPVGYAPPPPGYAPPTAPPPPPAGYTPQSPPAPPAAYAPPAAPPPAAPTPAPPVPPSVPAAPAPAAEPAAPRPAPMEPATPSDAAPPAGEDSSATHEP